MTTQTEETTTPKVTSDILEKKGLLQRIRGYETRQDSTAGQHQYLDTTQIKTDLEFLVDGEGIFPVSFNCFVGYEMVGQRVLYRQTTENKDGMFYGRHFTDKTVTQEIIPEDNSLPVYKAVKIESVR